MLKQTNLSVFELFTQILCHTEFNASNAFDILCKPWFQVIRKVFQFCVNLGNILNFSKPLFPHLDKDTGSSFV